MTNGFYKILPTNFVQTTAKEGPQMEDTIMSDHHNRASPDNHTTFSLLGDADHLVAKSNAMQYQVHTRVSHR